MEENPPPAAVTTARATLIDARAQPDEDAAARWLKTTGSDQASERVEAAVADLNLALAAHRVATADPLVREVSRAQALAVRLGYGSGEQVADGRWAVAVELPQEREGLRRRATVLRPQERLAALLGARDRALACEELTLRARLDLDSGRQREAALQLRVALEAALVELADSSDEDVAQRVAKLRETRGAVGDAANAALIGGLPEAVAADVERMVSQLEAALRARTIAALDEPA